MAAKTDLDRCLSYESEYIATAIFINFKKNRLISLKPHYISSHGLFGSLVVENELD